MKTWLLRALWLAALIIAGVWGWGLLHPNPERVIRQRLAEVAQVASFSGKESPLAQAANSQKLTTFCTPDIEIPVDISGHGQHTVSGHDELFQGAMGARALVRGLKVEFLDVSVTVGPDGQTAIVRLSAKGTVPGEKDLLAQELKMSLKKIGGDWLIQRIETIKPMS